MRVSYGMSNVFYLVMLNTYHKIAVNQKKNNVTKTIGAHQVSRLRYSPTLVRDKFSSAIYCIVRAMGALAPHVLGQVPKRTMKFVLRNE